MHGQNNNRIVAIVGPTASGKSSLGVALAEQFHGEIISADSRQIYRGMDIGTAKASREDQLAVPHHLIDIKNPNEEYTVADYKLDADKTIGEILKRGKLPFLVGGTGLYIKSVVENLSMPAIKSDPELRARIEDDIATDGLPAVFAKLVALDPEAAYIVDPKNPRRVVRALEVALITGEPFTAQRKKSEPLWNVLTLGITTQPEKLRERIDLRIDLMMQDGLAQEVMDLVKQYDETQTAFDAIGYREIIDYMNSKQSLQEAVETMKLNTWHYAQRQMTWFKKDKTIQWIENKEEASVLVEKFLAAT